jgi:hypothetical protein
MLDALAAARLRVRSMPGRVALRARNRLWRDHEEQAGNGSEAIQLIAAGLAMRQMRLNLAALVRFGRAQYVDT